MISARTPSLELREFGAQRLPEVSNAMYWPKADRLGFANSAPLVLLNPVTVELPPPEFTTQPLPLASIAIPAGPFRLESV